MAAALRPAVALIALASVLFVVAGALDALQGTSDVRSFESFALGAVNALVAILIARGDERILALRIGLAAFFVIERPVTAFAFGPKSPEAVAVHLVTALVEAVIFVSTLRVWRLGHGVNEADLAFLAIPQGPLPQPAGGPAAVPPTGAPDAPAKAAPSAPAMPISRRASWAVGGAALLLAIALVADAVALGIVPGATVDLASPAWLTYVFALVLLAVAVRAVHGGRLALRLMLAVTLVTFVERAFTPFVTEVDSALSVGLHLVAAVLSLALASLVATLLRSSRNRRQRRALHL